MEWDITSARGFARLRLGDDLRDVRARFGEHVTFRRTTAADETDHFVSVGVLATYDTDRRVSFLEIVEPATPRIAGVPLLGEPVDDVARALVARGVRVERDRDGATVVGWGVGLWAPDEWVDSVSIGERATTPLSRSAGQLLS